MPHDAPARTRMTDVSPLRRDDARGRLISIFVGAVLLPSLALSYVSINLVPKLAKANKQNELKRAEKTLYYIEKDLAQAAYNRALQAARAVGTDRLLDGRPVVIAAALREAGLDPDIFETLHLEGGSSPRRRLRVRVDDLGLPSPREILSELGPAEVMDEDTVPWTDPEGKAAGILRFRFACDYVHGRLIREYFEREFSNPDQSLVVRVTEPEGRVVYETAATRDKPFEVWRTMESPSFRGLKLALRYRDVSIDQDVKRWERGTLALIGFIDLMLGAGLYLVYGNLRREAHLSRLKSDFVANVSHELKTPLALIRLFAETLELGRVPTEEKARQYYRVINKESQRLTQLINNILDFSRIEAGRKEYRFAPTDVARVVREVIESYRFQIEQQGFALAMEIEDGLPPIMADHEALGQAVLNLVNNAIKYSSEVKSIAVAVRKDDDTIRVSVTDRGIGIPKGEHKKIFEKFYRGEDSLVHETKGSGLGLSLVRHIMEAHGGHVVVESTPGKGSTFSLVLPAGRREAPGARSEA
ncbi:MAG TPA: HAMP domain-containing sensor histidine kinase [Vicinamibacteria bacterium]|nr:HAMP domain-containing sensor histidine kinase [Vicinamibacteria bacterium]